MSLRSDCKTLAQVELKCPSARTLVCVWVFFCFLLSGLKGTAGNLGEVIKNEMTHPIRQ